MNATLKLKIIGALIILTIINSCKKTDDSTPLPQISCLPANLQDSLIAFYPFSAGSLNDVSGHNYNLANPTTATSGADRSANPNCAFSFNHANGDFLKYANPTFLNDFQTNSFSVSLWYKPVGVQNGFEQLIGRDSTPVHCPDTFGQWSVGLYDVRSAVFGINVYSIWQDDVGVADVWKHLVVTCTGTNLKLYINGVLTTSLPGTGCSTPMPTINSGDLFLGMGFNGMLDDVIIYNKILTPSEISQLYNLAACCQ